MAGMPEWQRTRTWLMANPHASVQDIMQETGCAFSTARMYHVKWRRECGMAPPKIPQTPNPRPPLRAVRAPVEDLPEMKRVEVLMRLTKIHKIIDKYQDQLEGSGDFEDARPLKANEVVQLANAVRSMYQSAQVLCDSYPGLSALFEDTGSGQSSSRKDADAERLRVLYGGKA